MKRYSQKRAKSGLDGMRALDLASSTPRLHEEPNRLPPLEFEPQPLLLPPAHSGGGAHNAAMLPTERPGQSQADAFQLGRTAQVPSRGIADGPGSSAAARKAAMASTSSQGLAPPPRFVLHTDAGSIENINANTTELPPTYNATDQAGGDSVLASSGDIPSPSVGAPQSPTDAGNPPSAVHPQGHE